MLRLLSLLSLTLLAGELACGAEKYDAFCYVASYAEPEAENNAHDQAILCNDSSASEAQSGAEIQR